MKLNIKSLIPYTPQILIFILCFIVQFKTSSLSSSVLLIISYSSYTVFAIGIFLSIWFNRSRIFFIIILLVLGQLLSNYCSVFYTYKNETYKILYPALCILLPLNIAVFSQFKESGIFSTWGKLKFIFIALQSYIVFMLLESRNQYIVNILNYKIPLLNDFEFPVTAVPFIIMCIILIFFIIKIYNRKDSLDIKTLIVIIAVLFSIFLIHDKTRSTLFLSSAGLILILGILEASHSMAYLDELTGIPSRRALKEDLLKLGIKYSIAMIDIDYFKKFNDTYGHDVGDIVLRMVAENLQKSTGGGRAYRFGGEEFTIIFPGKTLQETIPHLDELRDKVSKSGFTQKQSSKSKAGVKRPSTKQLFVTISIGAAEKNPDFKTPGEVMEAADKALYRAKKKGRNCVSK